MSDTDTLIAELRAGLKGVTPGPWCREDETNGETVITDNDGDEVATVFWDRHAVGNAHRDAAHIARCSPVNIAAILDERARDKALIEQMVIALLKIAFLRPAGDMPGPASEKLVEEMETAARQGIAAYEETA